MDRLVTAGPKALDDESLTQEQADHVVKRAPVAARTRCAPADPRMPTLDDMQEVMRAAYHG